MSEVADVLDDAAKMAAEIAKYTPPPISLIAGIAAVSLKAGAAIARAGQDPIVEITRILDRNPHVDKVRDEWNAFIDENWPVGRRKTVPPPASENDIERHETERSMPAVTGEDIYEDDSE